MNWPRLTCHLRVFLIDPEMKQSLNHYQFVQKPTIGSGHCTLGFSLNISLYRFATPGCTAWGSAHDMGIMKPTANELNQPGLVQPGLVPCKLVNCWQIALHHLLTPQGLRRGEKRGTVFAEVVKAGPGFVLLAVVDGTVFCCVKEGDASEIRWAPAVRQLIVNSGLAGGLAGCSPPSSGRELHDVWSWNFQHEWEARRGRCSPWWASAVVEPCSVAAGDAVAAVVIVAWYLHSALLHIVTIVIYSI